MRRVVEEVADGFRYPKLIVVVQKSVMSWVCST